MLVAERRRKDPRSIPRPWDKKHAEPIKKREDGSTMATGLGGMLAAAQMRGAVKLGG